MGEMVAAEVLATLDHGALLLLPNERAARAIQRAWDHLQRSRKLTVWEPAKAFSWRSWLHLCWRRLLMDGRVNALLLTPLQEQRVWNDVIANSAAPASLRSIQSLVALAAQAWQRVCAYRGQQQLRHSIPRLHGDALQFALWARSFEEKCRQEALLSESLLEEELIEHVRLRDLAFTGFGAAKGMLLHGFDRLTPAQTALLEALRSCGASSTTSPTPAGHPGLLVAAADETEELRACARWISARLKASPADRIALVVKDLETERDTIDSMLREILSPDLEDISADTEQAPYEFSLGRPLSHHSLVQTALDLLDWTLHPLPLERVSRLLLSPCFVPADQEMTARAEFDALGLYSLLRLRPEVTISGFVQQLRQSSISRGRLPLLQHRLEAMEEAQVQFDLRPRGYAEWTEWMRAWLARAQWGPASDSLSSYEYQLHERWESALDTLATLDFAGDTVDLHQALNALKDLSEKLIFAPEAKDASVQILGPIEAAGQSFDALWVLRAGEMQWPPTLAALPLLPWSVQRDLQMPGTDPARERAAALALTRRLSASATEIVFSYAHATVSAGPQRVAAVVRDLELQNVTVADLLGPEQPSASPVPLERAPDAALIAPLPDQVYPGGVRILQLQAACGFRAFAELRLGGAKLSDRDLGLNAMERGSVVHSALEEFWTMVKSQSELRAMEQTERDETVRRAVAKGLAHANALDVDRWGKAYLESQQVRLASLLHDWIGLELRRPEFTVVAQEEERKNIVLGPLRLSLRVDRIDLVDGHHVILDYKTGEAKTAGWLGDRPDEPQVPLYAVLASQAAAQNDGASVPLAAVGFGQVRAREMSLRGFATAPGILHPHNTKQADMDAESFDGQVARWYDVLERLAIEFATGDIRVRPKQYPSTCARCGQRLLCRLDASTIANEIAEEVEDQQGQQHG